MTFSLFDNDALFAWGDRATWQDDEERGRREDAINALVATLPADDRALIDAYRNGANISAYARAGGRNPNQEHQRLRRLVKKLRGLLLATLVELEKSEPALPVDAADDSEHSPEDFARWIVTHPRHAATALFHSQVEIWRQECERRDEWRAQGAWIELHKCVRGIDEALWDARRERRISLASGYACTKMSSEAPIVAGENFLDQLTPYERAALEQLVSEYLA